LGDEGMEANLDREIAHIIRRDERIDRELVLSFFENFARAEYALKRCGYVQEVSGKVAAAWDDFANFVEPRFNPTATESLSAAVNYFYENPPLKQILSDGTLAWSAPETKVGRTLRQLLVFVRRVRNNLFHGGKFPGVLHDDPARNNLLLQHGLAIVLFVLSLEPDVLRHFKDEA
jgi:hypothetical protein